MSIPLSSANGEAALRPGRMRRTARYAVPRVGPRTLAVPRLGLDEKLEDAGLRSTRNVSRT